MAEPGWYPDPEGRDSLRYWDGSSWTDHWSERERPPAEQARPTGAVERPKPRLIRNPHDAEEAAAEWLRWFGFEDAEATRVGADGGVDVRGRSMVAQVKAHMVPIGRPDLQRLYGVAQTERATSVFFSLMHYTRDAQEWADQVGMALFRFDHAGEPEAVNGYAAALVERAEHQSPRPREPEPPWWAIPVGCADETAVASIAPRRSTFRQTEQLAWVRQAWLPMVGLRYDFTFVNMRSRRREELFAQRRAAFELQAATMVGVPATQRPMIQIPPEQVTVTAGTTPEEVVDVVQGRFRFYRQHPQGQWPRTHASEVGIPLEARTLSVTIEGTFALPVYAALIGGPAGNRIAIAEGVTGQRRDDLSAIFTRLGPQVVDKLYAGRQVGPT